MPATATTVEDWARDYVLATRLDTKLAPPPPPAVWSATPRPQRLPAPGRPPELEVRVSTRRSVRRQKLRVPRHRAELLHTFLHHELQAAELMCWAILAFADAPAEFRAGLLGICRDELRHLGLYRRLLDAMDFPFGTFPVRDWFWERTVHCATPLQFVALLGMGFEGGNLDHAERFARWFDELEDREAAAIQRVVVRDETEHVRFATTWFRTWTGGLDFARWTAELVAPLTPSMLRGAELNTAARRGGGFSAEFLAALESYR